MKRADELLVDLSLVKSRSKARAIIEEGKVFVNGKAVDKPSRKFPEDTLFEISAENATLRYVSRAGLKLEEFLNHFKVSLQDLRILDAGASTGGFTDCALQHGAMESVCVDIGSGQLHSKLLNDSRVTNYEKTDVRNLTPDFFDGNLFDFICADLSFISLEKILPFLVPLLKNNSKMACLIKPQFETSAKIMRKNKGVIRDTETMLMAVEKIRTFAETNFPEMEIMGIIESPIKGGDGNTEYLLGLYKNKTTTI